MTPQQAILKARANPLAFIALAMGRPIGPIHARLVSYLLDDRDCYAELPRGHGKTTTGALTISWLLGHYPSIRVKILGSTDVESAKTASMIREIIETDRYRAVFPNTRIRAADTSKTRWRLEGARMGARDATLESMGIMGRAGGRFDLLWTDDISDLRNAVLIPAERDKVKDAYNSNWMPMRDIAAEDAVFRPRVWNTATPYHTNDITGDLRRIHTEAGTILRLPCTTNGGERISPWPEVFSHEQLQAQYERMGAMAYARAYELVPLSSDLLIYRPEWFAYYRPSELPKQTRTVAAIDWGYGKSEQSRSNPDYSVCIVGEVDDQRRLFLTDVLRVREPFPVFAKMAASLLERRGVSVVLAEANGPQRGIFDQFGTITRFPMVAVERHSDKHLRAAGSQPFVQGGKLFFPTDHNGTILPAFQCVTDEMTAFPAAAHDDTVDVVVDLCAEATRGSLTMSDRSKSRIRAPEAEKLFGKTSTRKPFFA
jgi:predicted phage terminase large subunit-like protein